MVRGLLGVWGGKATERRTEGLQETANLLPFLQLVQDGPTHAAPHHQPGPPQALQMVRARRAVQSSTRHQFAVARLGVGQEKDQEAALRPVAKRVKNRGVHGADAAGIVERASLAVPVRDDETLLLKDIQMVLDGSDGGTEFPTESPHVDAGHFSDALEDPSPILQFEQLVAYPIGQPACV